MIDVFKLVSSFDTPQCMARIIEGLPKDQADKVKREIYKQVKIGAMLRKVYAYGSGGFDGLGFRTRPWCYVYEIVKTDLESK
jgi:hypothetical protein